MGHGRRRLAVRAALLRHDAQRKREDLMARLAKSLPQELRYWVLVTAGVEHIEDHEEVPAARFADVAARMHDRIFAGRKRSPRIAFASWIDSRGRRRRDVVTFEEDTEERDTLPSPPDQMIDSPAFRAVWERIKGWEIDVGDGASGATGSHVAAILTALQDKYMMPAPGAVQAARDLAASLALCAREMPETLAEIEHEGQAARHPEYVKALRPVADDREDLAAERQASAAAPTDAPVVGDRVQVIAGRTARRSLELGWGGWTGTIIGVAVGGEDDTCDIRADATGDELRLYRDEFRVAPPGDAPVVVTAAFQGGPGPHRSVVEAGALRDYLDDAIRARQGLRSHYSTTGRWYLTGYSTALQSVRLAVFGRKLT